MGDYIARAIAAGGYVRAFACRTTDTVEEARRLHNMSPVVTVAMGRLLSGGVMMGSMMKNDQDRLTIRIQSQGPVEMMLVPADEAGHVKGFAKNPQVIVPNKNGHLDVAGAVGLGVLSVIKDTGLREPYVGDTILVTSEIGDDLTNYFAESEQVPSSVGLGVRMKKDATVAEAGGFIVQLMPGATQELTLRLENRLRTMPQITESLAAGKTPEDILQEILAPEGLEILDRLPVSWYCGCSRERMRSGLISLGKKELQEMIGDGKPIEVNCQFCGKTYEFPLAELKEMEQEAVRK